jgi:hypothetical protein
VCAALSRRRAHSERGKALTVLKWFEMLVTVARLEAEVKAIALRYTMACDSNPLHPDRNGQP